MGVDTKPQVFEREDKVYIVAPLSVTNPGQSEVEQYAFAEALKSEAPNENILWLRGHYVEADRPNTNGQQWTAGDLAIAELTPRLMPVTIMHDPSTAVGLIADAKLSTPQKDQVARARIDTSLAVWEHRFGDIAAECRHNYENGELMQSMECLPGYFECAECGKNIPNVAGVDPRPLLCEHLSGANGEVAARILRNVVFTGTGLIFGSRGSRGAFDEAHLDVFQDEVAEAHQKSHAPQSSKKRTPQRSRPKMGEITIEQSEFAELQKRPSQEELAAAVKRAEDAEEAKAQAEKDKEAAEIAKKTAEDEKAESDKKLKEAEEVANQTELADSRYSKLGSKFLAKLPESIASKLKDQAKTMKDEEWSSRLEELSELVKVKSDEKLSEQEEAEAKENGGGGEGGSGSEEEFTAEQIARAGAGSGSGSGSAPSPQARAGVFSGLYAKGTGQDTGKQ